MDVPSSSPIFWPHAPPHRLGENGTYFITGATYLKAQLFSDSTRLELLHNALLQKALQHGWQLEAWAVFPNHYHFIAQSPPSAPAGTGTDLRVLVTELHRETATTLNRLDGAQGRKVWHNFWDKHLTFEKSYLARLNYVHQNAVKHRLVENARDYQWCSAAWFERTASAPWIKTISRFKTDKLAIDDDFD
ncbi:MAG TPA: hypothetical protein VK956_10475 [Verrucomicrobium sp.]|nr:hypothetical protein [Verrucomicrobium sp.]